MDCVRRFLPCCISDPDPSPAPNPSTEGQSQTHDQTADVDHLPAGKSFFHGVGNVIVENATFQQNIYGDRNISLSEGLGTAGTQTSGNEQNNRIGSPGRRQMTETTIRAPHEIYYDELWKQKRGTPLWVPGPDLTLPREYRQNGINVGDVGILRLDEPFDFLFNIFQPSDHPINSQGVPDSFQPLHECHLSEFECDMGNGSIGSPSVRRSVQSDPSGLIFETSAPEGAILVLPKGSSRRSVKNQQSIRDYMTASTVESWYQYARSQGREFRNGSIVVVCKCDKATSWGIATFSSIEGQTTSLTFKQVDGTQPIRPTYEWICHGTANTQMRIGPSPDEISAFSHVVKNQCVFLHVLNTRLSDESWRKFQQQRGVEITGVSHDPMFVEGSSRQPIPGSAQRKSHQHFANHRHPPSQLNMCLLENCADAKVAITSDEDWISLMTEEGTLLSNQQLLEQIQQSFLISNKGGVVCLDRLDSKPPSEPDEAVKVAMKALREYEKCHEEQYLITAITHYHHAYETSNEDHNAFPDIAIDYAALLNEEDRLASENFNLEEVIRLLEQARGLMEKQPRMQTQKYGVMLNNLGQAYLDRYKTTQTGHDVKAATDTFNRARSHNMSSPVSPTYATSLIGSAAVLWTECRFQPQSGDEAKLEVAIEFLKLARELNDLNIQVECDRQLAWVYGLCYTRRKERNDLEMSIHLYSQVLNMLPTSSSNYASTLINFAKELLERCKLTQSWMDLINVEKNKDTALKCLDQVPGVQDLETEIRALMIDLATIRSKILRTRQSKR